MDFSWPISILWVVIPCGKKGHLPSVKTDFASEKVNCGLVGKSILAFGKMDFAWAILISRDVISLGKKVVGCR